VCTQEMCSFTDVYDRFRNANTVLLPISVDSIPTLKKFKAKLSEETPGTTRGNEELLAQLEAHRLSA
jgi:peroxiredoxin